MRNLCIQRAAIKLLYDPQEQLFGYQMLLQFILFDLLVIHLHLDNYHYSYED